MPIVTTIKKPIRFIQSTGTGSLTSDDFDQYHSLFANNPSIYGFNEILDLSTADLSALQFSDLMNVAERVSGSQAYDPDSKLAIVLRNKEQEEVVNLYQMARTLSDNPCRSLMVFFSHDEALKWIMGNPAQDEHPIAR